ncbi:carbon storage regulator [Paenibacillus sp. FSL A5-0031]|uniref:carbon storage regulator CsrA n=1 Tax=Paenibacillus sp. FSL A5-0031 TaxID=1920420 RepID=UPI00096BFC7A|nr:carbon storage regulator CsrA [Paenibacillus sp. FSL A5-0031]OME87139.1 carbon storage regulator [Paenibacillus sp. FSL A5-0031]
MLVLSRKSNESIMIGTNVEIIVLGVEGDNVKLGIRAPKEVDIHRKEIYMAIQAENRAAAINSLSIEDVTKFFKK